jgi:hypothetical protein
VLFEAGSNREEIQSSALIGCETLESRRIPALLTVLSPDDFSEMRLLKSLPFEPGSKHRETRAVEFDDLASLNSVFLPASVSVVHASVFAISSIAEIVADDANTNDFASGPFLTAFDGMTRCFGSDRNVIRKAAYEPMMTRLSCTTIALV